MDILIVILSALLVFWAMNLVALSHILEEKKIVYTQRILAFMMISGALVGVFYAS